jgi:ketosteroid isomerase-like protein
MPRSKAELSRSCFEAYQRGDRALLESVLSEDFQFTSPYDDHLDRATYFVHCWPNHDRMRSVTVEQIFEQHGQTIVTYVVETMDGRRFHNVELHAFSGDQIRKVEVFFGATYRAGAFLPQQTTSA